jgi:esterase/lipase superfamily enzyme
MAETVRVRFATNRNPVTGDDIFGTAFHNDNPNIYVTGSINVSRWSNLPDTGWAHDPTTLQLDPPIDAGSAAAVAAANNDLVAFVRDHVAANLIARPAESATTYGLVHLPGFASTFVEALRRAAQVANAYRAADVFCFSWPANGIVDRENYALDQADARASAKAIAHALKKLLATLPALQGANRPELHIIAHSMGAYALQHAIQTIRSRDAKLIGTNLFESAALMAPDVNYDALSKQTQLAPLLKLVKRLAVYKNSGDLALAVSYIVNGRARLGAFGPDGLAEFPRTVTSVDCSDVGRTQGDNGESHYGHQYYRLSPHVINDVRQVLRGTAPDEIEGRLAAIDDPADGRGWWLPYDTGATGVVLEGLAKTMRRRKRLAPKGRKGKALAKSRKPPVVKTRKRKAQAKSRK